MTRALVSPSWTDRNGQCAVNIIIFTAKWTLNFTFPSVKAQIQHWRAPQRTADLFLTTGVNLTVWEQASSSSYLRKKPGFQAWCHGMKNSTLVSHSSVPSIKLKFIQLAAPEKWSFYQSPMSIDVPGSAQGCGRVDNSGGRLLSPTLPGWLIKLVWTREGNLTKFGALNI